MEVLLGVNGRDDTGSLRGGSLLCPVCRSRRKDYHIGSLQIPSSQLFPSALVKLRLAPIVTSL